MTTSSSPTEEFAARLAQPKSIVPVALAIGAATFFLILDLTAINVAFGPFQRDLGATFSGMQWILDAYATSMAAALLLSGVFADRFGPRAVMYTGAGIFALASMMAALSDSVGLLIFARSVQGIGAAALLASVPVLVVHNFPKERRLVGFGIFGGASGIALAGGPLIGGALMAISWQWIFWVNLPAMLCTVLALYGCRSLGRSGRALGGRTLSAVVLGICLFALVFVLTHGYDMGLGDGRIVAGITVAIVAGGVFVGLQRFPAYELIDLALFRNRTFVGINLITLLVNMAVFPLVLISVLYFEIVHGLSPVQTGLRLMVLTVALFVGSAAAMAIQAKIGRTHAITVSLVALAAGLALLALLDTGSSWTTLIPGFIVAGFGMGVFNPLRAEGTAALVPEETTGMASGTGNSLQELGVAAGIAFSGTLFFQTMKDHFGAGFDELRERAAGGAHLPVEVSAHLDDAFVTAWDRVVLFGAATIVVGLLVWLATGRETMFRYEP
ncbi:MFS transporter [Nocardia sp. NPDC020380]|uniref:MFS transporter n=1 Tax=Nocardia sp. NPDC020380 TaxID=3364309 RepID=UPI0037AC0B79